MRTRKFCYKFISLFLVFVMMLSSCPFAFADGVEVVKLNDSSKWEGNPDKMEIVGDRMTIMGPDAIAVYKGLILTNEMVEFKAKFNFIESEAWIGFKFRSNNPSGFIWDNTYSYMILCRGRNLEILKRTKQGMTTLKDVNTNVLGDGKEHTIRMGVYDVPTGVNISMYVDGNEVISVVDTNNPIMGESYFSFNMYLTSELVLTTYGGDGGALGGIVDRNAKISGFKSLQVKDGWFINQYVGDGSEQGILPQLSAKNGNIAVKGKGGISYQKKVDFTSLEFDVNVSTMDGKRGFTTFLFIKRRREQANGDISYGVRVSPDGQLCLVKHGTNSAKVFPAYETGVDFTKTQNIKVEVVELDEFTAEFYFYINSDNKAYKYTDDKYNPNYTTSKFIGIINSDFTVVANYSNIKYVGTELDASFYEEVPEVYFADYMVEEDGKKFLHWVYREDFPIYKGVIITDKKGNVVGEVDFPEKVFELPADHKYLKLYITTVSGDGKKSGKVEVNLKEKRSQYYEDCMERVLIRKGEDFAEFYLKESKKEFIVNGVNYIGLRFGDHSTFEPATDFIPEAYDPYTAETLFKVLKKNGYNTVRIFIMNGRTKGNNGLAGDYLETKGIYTPYMENVVDFIKRAKKYGIYVMPNFAENGMINNKYFFDKANGASEDGIMFSQAGLEAKKEYLKLFLEYIKNTDESLMDCLLAIEMQNEFVFHSDRYPFNIVSGTYTFMDGTKYDMSSAEDRRALANAALKNYYREMKETIKSVDSDLLMAEGTFTLEVVGKRYEKDKGIFPSSGKAAFPMTIPELLSTDIDFLDLHVYRTPTKNDAVDHFVKDHLESMLYFSDEAKELMKSKPIILGEFGSKKSDQDTFEEAGQYMLDTRDAAIRYGFKGAMIWTIDTFCQTGLWHAMEDNGEFLAQLSLLPPKKSFLSSVSLAVNNALSAGKAFIEKSREKVAENPVAAGTVVAITVASIFIVSLLVTARLRRKGKSK